MAAMTCRQNHSDLSMPRCSWQSLFLGPMCKCTGARPCFAQLAASATTLAAVMVRSPGEVAEISGVASKSSLRKVTYDTVACSLP